MRWLGSIALALALAGPPLLAPPVPPVGAEGLVAFDHRGLLWLTLLAASRSLLLGVLASMLAMAAGAAAGLLLGAFGPPAARPAPPPPARGVPAFLSALVAIGIARSLWPAAAGAELATPAVVLAIALARFRGVSRAVSRALREGRAGAPALAARGMGRSRLRALLAHALPGSLAPAFALGHRDMLLAARDEVALSFLGAGVAATQPSLGVLIRLANTELMAEHGWSFLLPAAALAAPLALAGLFRGRPDPGELA